MTKTLEERRAEAGKAYSKADKARDDAWKALNEAEEAMDAIIKEEGGK